MAPDVLPVPVADPAVQRRARLQQLREHVPRPVDRNPGRHLGQHLGLHDVDAGVHGVGEHLPPGGLLQEPLDAPLLVHDDDPELKRVGHPGERDGDQGAVLLVVADQGGQVDVGEGVARDDQERVGPQLVLGVLHAARRPQRHLLGGVLQAHADVLAVAEVIAYQRGQELDRHHGLGEPVPLEQQQHVFHDRLVHHRQQWLGLVGGHRAQPGALPARHHHCLHLLPVSSANTAYLPSFHRGRARVMASVPAAPVTASVPAPRTPPSRPGLAPGRRTQTACLLQVQHGGPPVQGSSPDREGPTDDPRHQRRRSRV